MFAGYNRFMTQEIRPERQNVGLDTADARHLLKEVHHQVKNNLQVVCSLLRLQSRAAGDSSAKVAFRRGEERIQSMALVYDMLHRSDLLSGVAVQQYLPEMARQLLAGSRRAITPLLECSIDSVSVSSRVATHLGLLVNEILSHRLRQPMGDDQRLRMYMRLARTELGMVLELADNGPSYTQSGDVSTVETQILEALIRQVEGVVEYPKSEGFAIKIAMPASVFTEPVQFATNSPRTSQWAVNGNISNGVNCSRE